MRILILFLIFISSTVYANELEKAYQKEFAYLVSEKKALQQRLGNLKKSNTKNLSKITAEIDQLQKQYLQGQNSSDRLNQQIVEASRGVDHVENDSLLLETTLLQAIESLKKTGSVVDESQASVVQLQSALAQANRLIQADGSVYIEEGQFFQQNGESATGEIVHVGRIAKYGLNPVGGGALAPSGNGLFRVWNESSLTSAKSIKSGQSQSSIEIFLFDNADKAIDQKEKRGIEDDVIAGGVIGKVIIVIGIIGFLLVIVRALFLMLFSSDINKITNRVSGQVREGKVDDALKTLKKKTSSASKVIAATLRNLDRDRDHIEDIISESILHESSRIDRFGAAILVIAAISPLLGLLGTVTGMISTFDIITEFGTGDPKLLSSGISEALITTKFGLIVAIPMLLLGNVLSGWATRIKNDLEQAALHMINTHKA